MDRNKLDCAAKLHAALVAAEDTLARAKSAKIFKLEMRPGGIGGASFEYIGHCAGVSEGAIGSYGALATDLRAAAVKYCEFHVELIAGELRGLGVEL